MDCRGGTAGSTLLGAVPRHFDKNAKRCCESNTVRCSSRSEGPPPRARIARSMRGRPQQGSAGYGCRCGAARERRDPTRKTPSSTARREESWIVRGVAFERTMRRIDGTTWSARTSVGDSQVAGGCVSWRRWRSSGSGGLRSWWILQGDRGTATRWRGGTRQSMAGRGAGGLTGAKPACGREIHSARVGERQDGSGYMTGRVRWRRVAWWQNAHGGGLAARGFGCRWQGDPWRSGLVGARMWRRIGPFS